jgi:pimeloyl-ACP methyl ester carboxylesterase
VITARPNVAPPDSAFASLNAWLAYDRAARFPGLRDARRIEGYQRAKVVIQPDGRVKERLSKDIRDALYAALLSNPPRDYGKVRCPALVIYAQHYYPSSDQSAAIRAYEQNSWAPFQKKSIERIRRELAGAEVVQVPGAHGNFLFLSRQRVVEVIDRFLARTAAAVK